MTEDIAQEADTDLFNCPYSFMGVPFSTDVSHSKAAILGIPFDCGTHPSRIGSRQGPQSIREQSALVRPYQPPLADFNPLTRLNVVDCGDVDVTPGVIQESFDRIEAAILRVASAGTIPVTMGGDGAVTLPQLRALHKIYPDLVVLHIDAHTDTYPGAGNQPHDLYNTATTFTRAAEEGVVDTKNSMHSGPRGPVTRTGVFEHTREHGYGLIDGDELFQRGLEDVLALVHKRFAATRVQLCF